MKENYFDFIIIGGGCSGLSLALALSKKELHKTILILENRQQYISDRTWCFWGVNSHPFEKQVQYRWKRWQVRYKNEILSLESNRYEYQCIPSENFYQEATLQIKHTSNVTLLMDTQVSCLKEESTTILLETTQGPFTCSQVYDSRPDNTPSALYQHFQGWQVMTEYPVFNPKEVILMDFDVDQTAGIAFMYLLPFTTHQALIEATYISPLTLALNVYETAIQHYLDKRYALRSYKIIHKEKGALPLKIVNKPVGTSRIIPIGAKAGWMRASTGYAFLPIQEAIKKLLDSSYYQRGKGIENYLDKLFLLYIHEHPERAPELFFNLFKKNSAESMVRFLMSKWSYQDLFQMMLRMPKLEMIKKALL